MTTLPQDNRDVPGNERREDAIVSSNADSWAYRKVESRRKLLNAARKLFAETGYHQIRTQDITKEAAVGYGTFYLQFEDKLDCYLAVVQEASIELRHFLKPYMEKATTFSEQVRALLDASFDYSLAHPGVLRTIVADTRILSSFRGAPVIREHAIRENSDFFAFVEKWQKAGEIDPGLDAKFAFYLILGTVKQGDALVANDPRNKTAIVETATEFLVRGLGTLRASPYERALRDLPGLVLSADVAALAASFSTPKENPDTRERILVAARELFTKHGYDQVKPKEITVLAGVGVGTFYSYFEDKLDCFLAVANEAANELHALGRAYIADATSFADLLRRLLQATYDYSAINPGIYRLLVADVRFLAQSRKRTVRRGLGAFQNYLETGKKAGAIAADADTKVLVYLITGIVTQGDEFILNHPEQRDAIIESVTRLIYDAIAVDTDAAV